MPYLCDGSKHAKTWWNYIVCDLYQYYLSFLFFGGGGGGGGEWGVWFFNFIYV